MNKITKLLASLALCFYYLPVLGQSDYPPQKWQITLKEVPAQACTMQNHKIPYSGQPPRGYYRTVDVEFVGKGELIVTNDSGDDVFVARCNESDVVLPATSAFLVAKFHKLGNGTLDDNDIFYCETFPFCDDYVPPPVGTYRTRFGDIIIVEKDKYIIIKSKIRRVRDIPRRNVR